MDNVQGTIKKFSKDYERSWGPKEVTTDKKIEFVHSLIMLNRRSLRDIVGQIGICYGAYQSILTNIFGISKASARWVPRMLSRDQKKIFLSISCLDDPENFMRRVLIQNETWVYNTDPEAKKQNMK